MPVNDNMCFTGIVRLLGNVGYLESVLFVKEDVDDIVVPPCVTFKACHCGFWENKLNIIRQQRAKAFKGSVDIEQPIPVCCKKPELRMGKHGSTVVKFCKEWRAVAWFVVLEGRLPKPTP